MSDTQSPLPPSSTPLSQFLPKRSFGLKLLLVCLLALLMAIPAGFVWGLVYERESNADRAIDSVSSARGGRQIVMGPILSVPVERRIWETRPVGPNGQQMDVERKQIDRLVIFAQDGHAQVGMTTEVLKRGIHDAPVFEADYKADAEFDLAAALEAVPDDGTVLWERAEVVMGLSDLRGVRSEVLVNFNGETLSLAPFDIAGGKTKYSSEARNLLGYQNMALVSAPLDGLNPEVGETVKLSGELNFSGAQRLGFTAFAKNTTIAMTGDWSSPSFEGGFLPASRDVREEGFDAEWSVPFLARGESGAGMNLSISKITNENMGVLLLDEASPYRSVTRALKYSPMFIGLVFLTYFLFEATSGTPAHPAQYVLVGLAQAVFYLLLLSVSEHLGFTAGFLFAAVATVGALSLYAGSVFRSSRTMGTAFAVFGSLYALIYILMRMEDYALLVGSLASFAAIAATMWMTRDLDWYGLTDRVNKPS